LKKDINQVDESFNELVGTLKKYNDSRLIINRDNFETLKDVNLKG